MAADPQLKEYQRKRDFKKTAEPSGSGKRSKKKSHDLAFVIQKHEASHLHYDLRLEVNGVMKSWSVPKGPSFDTSVKRLAVQVEDHPMDYNTFEGTIPQGEYGGGTVMLWDEGSYRPDNLESGEDPEKVMEEAIEAGKISFTFHGARMRGSFTLVRTRQQSGRKPQWLLMKHRDEFANTDYDPVAEIHTSVRTDRTMTAIEEGQKSSPRKSKSPKSNPSKKEQRINHSRSSPTFASQLSPMLVSTAEDLPTGDKWVYEQKLDGVRVLAYVDDTQAALISRLGKNKAFQFPEIAEALIALSKKRGEALILDGEITAVNTDGEALDFGAIQGRIHLDDTASIVSEIKNTPVVFYAFDILLQDQTPLAQESFNVRRKALEKLIKDADNSRLSLSPLFQDAEKAQKISSEKGWEGLIAKRKDSSYQPGVRAKTWWKWRVFAREELVIAGWTDPAGSRKRFGSLLLGYYDTAGQLRYAGHVGTGFSQKTLDDLYERLLPLERKSSPFADKVDANNTPHWVTPELVGEFSFKSWTSDHKLRHGTFIGLRDDKKAQDVVFSQDKKARSPEQLRTESESDDATHSPAPRRSQRPAKQQESSSDISEILTQIKRLKKSGGEILVGDHALRISHPDKIYFPEDGIRKRDLLAYYAGMSDLILPWMMDRPLVMKRFPNGIDSESFYQQAPDDQAPGHVERLETDQGRDRRLVGGALSTLLYLPQMGSISYDPWHARIGELDYPDYTIIDLDPTEGTEFAVVRDVAQACVEYLEKRKVPYAMKTSGATGIHIYLPLPPRTSWETARLVAELICAKLAEEHSDIATVQRMVKKRKKGMIYCDAQQNHIGKSVAGVWAVRARPGATVSTPICLKDLKDGIEPEDFTIRENLRPRARFWDKRLAEPIRIEQLLDPEDKPAKRRKSQTEHHAH